MFKQLNMLKRSFWHNECHALPAAAAAAGVAACASLPSGIFDDKIEVLLLMLLLPLLTAAASAPTCEQLLLVHWNVFAVFLTQQRQWQCRCLLAALWSKVDLDNVLLKAGVHIAAVPFGMFLLPVLFVFARHQNHPHAL